MQDIYLHVNYRFQPNVQQILPPQDRIIGPSLEFQVPSCHSPGPATHRIQPHPLPPCMHSRSGPSYSNHWQSNGAGWTTHCWYPSEHRPHHSSQLPVEAVKFWSLTKNPSPSGLPSQARLIAHDVATGQPTQVAKPGKNRQSTIIQSADTWCPQGSNGTTAPFKA